MVGSELNILTENLSPPRTDSPTRNDGASRSAAAATTDDPDCLRLQDSRVLFSSDDDGDDSDSDVAPKRRRRSDPESPGKTGAGSSKSSAQKSFEKIVDSLPENLRANWTYLRQRRICFRQLEFGECPYKDKYVSRLTIYKYVSHQEGFSKPRRSLL